MVSEEDRVHEIMQEIAAGNEVGNKLVFDSRTKTIRPAPRFHDPDLGMVVTPEDMAHSGRHERGG